MKKMNFLTIDEIQDISIVLSKIDSLKNNEFRMFFKDPSDDIYLFRCLSGVINMQKINTINSTMVLGKYNMINKYQFGESIFTYLNAKYSGDEDNGI